MFTDRYNGPLEVELMLLDVVRLTQVLFTFPRCHGKREQCPSKRLTSWALMWIPTKGEALIKDAIVKAILPYGHDETLVGRDFFIYTD